jgi:hypothetical protein
MKQFFYIFGLIFLAAACKTDNPENKSFRLPELEKNKDNVLKLRVEEKPDLMVLTDKLSEMNRGGIEKFLEKKGLSLFEASYALHFLGNRYFSENQFDKGMLYQQIAADYYLNPYAMLRLALIYSKSADEIQKSLPKGQATYFKQDFAKSFYYLHWAINTAIMTMEYFSDRTVAEDINRFGAPIISLYEKKDAAILGNFDITAAEKKAVDNLPIIKATFEKLYRVNQKNL